MVSSPIDSRISSAENRGMRPRPAYYAVTGLCFAGLVFCIGTDATWPSLYLAVLGVLSLAAVDVRGIFVLGYPVYGLGGALWSVVLIENGSYITEQFRYGANVGASAILALYALGFLTVAHMALTLRFGTKPGVMNSFQSRTFERTILIGSVVTGIFYAYAFATNGLGLSYASRFDWIRLLPPAIGQLNGVAAGFLIPALFGIAGFAWHYFHLKIVKFWPLLIPFAALVGTGEKFSAFFSAFMVLLAGIGIAAYLRGTRVPFRFSQVLVASVVVIAMLNLIAEGYRRLGAADVLDAMLQRVVLQGHVWYGVYEELSGVPGVPLGELFGRNTLDDPAGLDLLSYLVTSNEYVYTRIAGGITFTMGGPPSFLAGFGTVPGFFLYSVLGLMYPIGVGIVIYFIRRGAPARALVAWIPFLMVGSATQMGRWDSLYGTVAFGAYAFVAVCAIHMESSHRRSVTGSRSYRTARSAS